VIHFDAATGAVLHQSGAMKSLARTLRFISGMHQIQFRHGTLRALYFALGLSGCVLILSGFLVWLQARRRRHAAEGRAGVRIVEAIAVGSTVGIMSPRSVHGGQPHPAARRVVHGCRALRAGDLGFYLVWLATFAHVWWRPRGAWPGNVTPSPRWP